GSRGIFGREFARGCRGTSRVSGTVIDGSGHALASHDRRDFAADIAQTHFGSAGQRAEWIGAKKRLIAAECSVVVSETIVYFGLFKECGFGWPRALAARQK